MTGTDFGRAAVGRASAEATARGTDASCTGRPGRDLGRGSLGSGRYRALQRSTLESLLVSIGFTMIAWLMPEVSGYYQPIVLATA